MDRLYDMLIQVDYFPAQNRSGPRKDDSFGRFHKAMEHNIERCKEFH